jgi:hypothetical protein
MLANHVLCTVADHLLAERSLSESHILKAKRGTKDCRRAEGSRRPGLRRMVELPLLVADIIESDDGCVTQSDAWNIDGFFKSSGVVFLAQQTILAKGI